MTILYYKNMLPSDTLSYYRDSFIEPYNKQACISLYSVQLTSDNFFYSWTSEVNRIKIRNLYKENII